MDKVYFRDNPKMSILKSIMAMINLKASLKNTTMIPIEYLDAEKSDKLRKAFVECYTMEDINEAKLIEELEKKCNEIGIEIDSEKLRENCVMQVVMESKMLESMPQEQVQMINRSKEFIANTFVFDILYEYFEENLKKIIVSELFKRIFGMAFKLNFTIKVSSERIDKIFEDETIKSKENFFCQQLKTWATYNEIVLFIKYEIKEREEEPEKKDIFINVNILNKILEMKI